MKVSPRLLSIGFCILWGTISITQASELSIGDDCDIAGGVAETPVTFVNDSQITALQFDVLYNADELAPIALLPGDAFVDHLLDWSITSEGTLRVVVLSPTNTPLTNGTLVSVQFEIDAGATETSNPVEVPINGEGNPPYAGPGVILADVTATSSLPDPSPMPGEIELVQIESPVGQATCIGGSATMSCSATGDGPTTYEWIKDGQSVPDATESEYTVAVAETSDTGDYWCEINNACGDFTTDSALLDVAEFPCEPTDLRVYDPGTGGALLAEWNPNPSPSVDKYTLNWGTTEGGPYTFSEELPVVDGTSVAPLTDGTRYYFTVNASVASVPGPLSNEDNAVPTAGGFDLPEAPDYGYETTPSNDTTHPDVVTYRFPPRIADVTIWYDVYDVDSQGEVAIELNGQVVELPAATADFGWSGLSTVTLENATVKDDSTNVLTFDNLLSPPILETWGVRTVSIQLPAPGLSVTAWNLTVDLAIYQNPQEPSLGSYDIFRGDDSGFIPSPTNRIASGFVGTVYRDDIGLINGEDYFYVVRPIDTISNPGVDSAEVTAMPTDTDVTPVFDLTVSKSGTDDIELSWSPVTTTGGVQHYKLYEGLSPGSLPFTGTTTTETSLVQTGHQSDGLAHYYSLGVVDNTGAESSQ